MMIKAKGGEGASAEAGGSAPRADGSRPGMSGPDAAFGDFRREMRAEMAELVGVQFRALEERLDSKIEQRLGSRGGADDAAVPVVDLVEDEQEIERIILENTEEGVDFYPSDIIFKFNLDLKTTMGVIHKMVERGVLDG